MQAKCHPKKPHEARGLCKACYEKRRLRLGFGNHKRYRQKQTVCDCHPDRKPFSNNLCRPCYQKHWRTVIRPTYYHDFNAKYRYGLTSKQHNKLLARKHCEICGIIPKHTKIRNLVIDHNPKSNIVRGVLCRKCNSNLGWYEKKQTKINNYLKKG